MQSIPQRDIDTIVAAVQAKYPELSVEQLKVAHPGVDDDGLWFFNHPGSPCEVQLESPDGMFPFIAETLSHGDVAQIDSVDSAVRWLESELSLFPST